MSTNLTGAAFGGNICVSKAGLAAGTTTTSTIGADTNYAIAGRMYTKSSASNATTPTTDHATGAAFRALAANQACIFVYALDAAGAIKVIQGPIVSLSDVTGKLSAVHFPGVPDDVCPIGYLYAQAGATLSGTWLFGTNNLSSVTGMTYTFRDLAVLPAAPITA